MRVEKSIGRLFLDSLPTQVLIFLKIPHGDYTYGEKRAKP
jgi:hypothetical protein